MKISFVGQSVVGKDLASNYLAKKLNLVHISSGDIIRQYVTENNLGGLDRENLRIAGKKLRDEKGGDIIIKIALEKNPDNIVISGLRSVAETETFKKLGGKIISITAPIEKRFEWTKARERIDDNILFEDFKRISDEEFSSKDKNSQSISDVIAMADFEIVNDGTIEELYKKIDNLKI